MYVLIFSFSRLYFSSFSSYSFAFPFFLSDIRSDGLHMQQLSRTKAWLNKEAPFPVGQFEQ